MMSQHCSMVHFDRACQLICMLQLILVLVHLLDFENNLDEEVSEHKQPSIFVRHKDMAYNILHRFQV